MSYRGWRSLVIRSRRHQKGSHIRHGYLSLISLFLSLSFSFRFSLMHIVCTRSTCTLFRSPSNAIHTRRSSHSHADLLKAREQVGDPKAEKRQNAQKQKREHERLPCSLNLGGMWSLCTRSFLLLLTLRIRTGKTNSRDLNEEMKGDEREHVRGTEEKDGERNRKSDYVIAPLYVTWALRRHFSLADMVAVLRRNT